MALAARQQALGGGGRAENAEPKRAGGGADVPNTDGCAAAAAQPKEKSDLTSQHAIKNSQVTDNAANTDVGVGDGGGGDDGDDDEAEAEAEGEGDGEGEPTAMRQKAAAANIVWTWLNHLQPRSAEKLGCSLSDMCEAKNLDGHGTSEKLVARLIANTHRFIDGARAAIAAT